MVCLLYGSDHTSTSSDVLSKPSTIFLALICCYCQCTSTTHYDFTATLNFFGRVPRAEMGKMIESEERTHVVGTITSRPRLS
jgi:hypothetical protein